MIGPIAFLEPFPPQMQQKIIELAGPDCDVRFSASAEPASQAEVLQGANYAVIRAGVRTEVMVAAPWLKLVVKWGSGVDGVPTEALRDLGIPVARCAAANAPTIADMTLGLMLAALRRIPQTSAALKAGKWDAAPLRRLARDLAGAEVGLVGYGAIGQLVAARLRGFGCVIRYTRASGPLHGDAATYCELDELLAKSDIVSLHLPLTNQTRSLFDAARFAKMKPGATFINTARGAIVDEAALIEALQSGHLGAAGLDVFAAEPTAADNPLLTMDNVVALPHVAGFTIDNFHRMTGYVINHCRSHAAGKPINPADLV